MGFLSGFSKVGFVENYGLRDLYRGYQIHIGNIKLGVQELTASFETTRF